MAKHEKGQEGYTVCDTMNHEVKDNNKDLERASAANPSSIYGTFSTLEKLGEGGALPLRQTEQGPLEIVMKAFIASLVVVGIITGFSYLGVMLILG